MVITNKVVDYNAVFESLRKYLDAVVYSATVIVVWETGDNFVKYLQELNWRVCKMQEKDQLAFVKQRADLTLIACTGVSKSVQALEEALHHLGIDSKILVTGHSMSPLSYPYG